MLLVFFFVFWHLSPPRKVKYRPKPAYKSKHWKQIEKRNRIYIVFQYDTCYPKLHMSVAAVQYVILMTSGAINSKVPSIPHLSFSGPPISFARPKSIILKMKYLDLNHSWMTMRNRYLVKLPKKERALWSPNSFV